MKESGQVGIGLSYRFRNYKYIAFKHMLRSVVFFREVMTAKLSTYLRRVNKSIIIKKRNWLK